MLGLPWLAREAAALPRGGPTDRPANMSVLALGTAAWGGCAAVAVGEAVQSPNISPPPAEEAGSEESAAPAAGDARRSTPDSDAAGAAAEEAGAGAASSPASKSSGCAAACAASAGSIAGSASWITPPSRSAAVERAAAVAWPEGRVSSPMRRSTRCARCRTVACADCADRRSAPG